MITIFKREFWDYALERAVKSAAQAAATLLIGVEVLGLFSVDWVQFVSVTVGMAVFSIVTSMATLSAPDHKEGEDFQAPYEGKRRLK